MITLLGSTALCLQAQSWRPPFEVLPAPTDSAPIPKQLGSEKAKVYGEGDVLTPAYRSGFMSEMAFNCLSLGVSRVGTSDIWAGQARYSRWNEAFFAYTLLSQPGSTSTGPRIEMLFGSSASKLSPTSNSLRREVKTHTIKSSALGEDRTFFIHMPPSAPKGIPTMYLAGGPCNDLAAITDTKIVAARMRPFAIVNISSGGYQGVREKPYDLEQDFSAHEYLEMYE